MNHEQLWAPWRLAYIKQDEPPPLSLAAEPRWLPGADHTCFICRGVAEDCDRQNLLVHRDAETVTILNRYPYNNGHLLVAPKRHTAALDQLTAGEQLEIQQTIVHFVELLKRLMNAEGFNIGLNLGRVAGAGLPGHLHWHIVPRWNGDTNFMPVLAGIRVIPQSLDSLWELLTTAATTPPVTATNP